MPSINEMGCDSEPEDMEEEMSITYSDKSEEEESESGSSGSDDDSSGKNSFASVPLIEIFVSCSSVKWFFG